MKNRLINWTTVCLLFCLSGVGVTQAENRIEVRTLQTWNLPHPFEGPKNLTENVFGYLMHPAIDDYARENSLDISYSKDNDCLYILGNSDPITQILEGLQQLKEYDHPYVSLYGATTDALDTSATEVMIRFPKICVKTGNVNLLRKEIEYLPVLTSKWQEPVRYGMKSTSYPTLGDFGFPKTVTGAKGKTIRGELSFSPRKKNRHRPIHVLSYAGMSKEDLREFLNNTGGEERIYLDVPYKKLLTKKGKEGSGWGLYRVPSKSLKMMCPNYNNPKIKELFKDLEYRRIIQKAVDLVYHTGAVGLTDTGLQPVHRSNALALGGWRQFSSIKLREEQRQLKNQWEAWLKTKGKGDGKIGSSFRAKNGQELIDIKTKDLPKLRLFFADNINDSTYFVNLKEFLGKEEPGLGVIDLEIKHGDDFITVDKFRKILAGDDQLSDGHEGVVFDIPVPYNDHVEHYLSKEQNFFGLDKDVAELTLAHAEAMLKGDWVEGATDKMGRLLREEVPCIIIGQHRFYVYTRNQGDNQLAVLPDKVKGKRAPTASKLARRISESALK